ncbi:nuclear transport factor 2 family protein [Solimonas sp. K1W22B-7]|uniref:nuclear transport factor 2 family protein n=1 Tax=Solimonas sp. K1W22B-7 TaxID=2303331 RepID=UPI000E33644F|nr:nuclear transport factor 2 family protein [Solimonas sp. K1W22B-7]AXQ28889.1 nuclear transport factor 2 family protein [Solimonas sp. K1W22B-7]
MTTEQRNRQAAQAFFDILNRGDVPALIDAYAEDGRCVTMGNTLISGTYSKDQVAAAAGGIYQVFPQGIRFTIKAMTAEGERVAVEAESEGAHISGQLYTNQYHFLMRFRDGKVVEFKEYMDTERVTDILCGGQKRPAA